MFSVVVLLSWIAVGAGGWIATREMDCCCW
jgi:hypothetical protein